MNALTLSAALAALWAGPLAAAPAAEATPEGAGPAACADGACGPGPVQPEWPASPARDFTLPTMVNPLAPPREKGAWVAARGCGLYTSDQGTNAVVHIGAGTEIHAGYRFSQYSHGYLLWQRAWLTQSDWNYVAKTPGTPGARAVVDAFGAGWRTARASGDQRFNFTLLDAAIGVGSASYWHDGVEYDNGGLLVRLGAGVEMRVTRWLGVGASFSYGLMPANNRVYEPKLPYEDAAFRSAFEFLGENLPAQFIGLDLGARLDL